MAKKKRVQKKPARKKKAARRKQRPAKRKAKARSKARPAKRRSKKRGGRAAKPPMPTADIATMAGGIAIIPVLGA